MLEIATGDAKSMSVHTRACGKKNLKATSSKGHRY